MGYRKKVVEVWRTFDGPFSPMISTTGHHCPSVNARTAFEALLECGHVISGNRKKFPKTMKCYKCDCDKQ